MRRPGVYPILLLIVFVTFLLHLMVLPEPFGRDQGIFAYIGDVVHQGGLPYRDAWDHKPPALYAVYALAFSLFGRSMTSIHLLEGIYLAFTTGALGLVLARLGPFAPPKDARTRCYDWGMACTAAAFYGVGSTVLFEWWDRGQAEIYMGLPGVLVLGALLMAKDQPRWRSAWMILAGAAGAVATLFKPTGAGLLALGGAGVILWVPWRMGKAASLRPIGRAMAAISLGVAMVVMPVLVIYATGGALGDLLDTLVVFNLYHARIGGNPTPAGIISGTLDFLASMNILAPLAIVGAVVMLARERTPTNSLVLFWLAATILGVWSQGKFFSYHWSAVMPAFATVAAYGATQVWQDIRREPRAGAVVLIVLVVVYGNAFVEGHLPKLQRDMEYLLGRMDRETFLGHFAHNIADRDVYSFLDTERTASYLTNHTQKDDRVLVWGFQALVNFLADRKAPTRYIFTYPLTFDRPESVFRVQARRTFLSELATHPPTYIVLVSRDVNPLQAVDSVALLDGFPEFKAYLREYYVHDVDIGNFHLYRRTP